jgi:hypothetical protein
LSVISGKNLRYSLEGGELGISTLDLCSVVGIDFQNCSILNIIRSPLGVLSPDRNANGLSRGGNIGCLGSGTARPKRAEDFMIASIWKDGDIAFRGSVEVSLIDSLGISGTPHCEGTVWVVGGEQFDVRGSYRLELEDGNSADIILTYLLGRNPLEVHFRVLAWKGKPSRDPNSSAARM